MSAVPTTSDTRTAPRNQAPIADWVNEWTDWTTPDRVRNVPSSVSVKVVVTRIMVQVEGAAALGDDRRVDECAVAVSHGRVRRSTGSQAQ